MNKEIITYKNKQYEVTNPGILMYSSTKLSRGKASCRYPEIVDQLDNCSEIPYHPGRIGYLKEKYNLTELEYYIIVVCKGDESKLPRCSYVNPYTGEKCNEPKKFRTLVPGRFQRTKVRMGIFHEGCEKHANNAAAQKAQRENYKKGVTGLQKADRKSSVWREKLSKHAKKQMKEGRSIFSPGEVRDSEIPSAASFGTNSIDVYKNIAKENNIPCDELTIENMILMDKLRYLEKGNSTDLCTYYITLLEGRDDVFKVGVTIDVNRRIKTDYHGFYYTNTIKLFTSTRENIADLEYKVKLKFKDYIILGNEGFDISVREEMLKFIKELIEQY